MRKYLVLMVGILGILVVAHLGLAPHAVVAASHTGVQPLTGTPYEP